MMKYVPDQKLGQFLSNYVVGHVSMYPTGRMLSLSNNVVLYALKQYN